MKTMSAEDGEKRTRHPSFGIISISRGVCSENMNLFGSSILQRSFIRVDIHNAVLIRNLHRDWIMQEGVPIISVYLSPSQFADTITSLNTEGTPCTINFLNGQQIKQSQFESKRMQFDAEFEAKMREITSDTNKFYSEIEKILSKPSIGKHDREAILKQIDFLKMQIASNIPFLKKQFTEQMDQTVVEAKNEIASFIDDKIKKMGLENFKKELQKSLEHVEKQ